MRALRSTLCALLLAGPAQAADWRAEVQRLFRDPALAETRAVIVMRDGRTIFEGYGKGFGPATPLIGWSMSKSLTATLVGQLVAAGKLNLDAPAPVAAWRKPNDARARITLRHLLDMASGLQHDELGRPAITDSDTNRALFSDVTGDAAAFAIAKPLSHSPGYKFNYSSLTTIILSDIIVRTVAPQARNAAARRAAMRAHLKASLPMMPGLVCEFDRAGTMIGGSLCHAPAREWAAFGQTYLDGGVWRGRQVVPAAWVARAREPSPGDSGYSLHWWLNRPRPVEKADPLFSKAGPADAYSAIGHLGQYVLVVPSKRLVVVRMGKTQDEVLDPVPAALGRLVNAL